MSRSFYNNKVIFSLLNGAKHALPHTLYLTFSTLISVPINLMGYPLKINLPLAFVTVDTFARCDQNIKTIKNRKDLAHENHKIISEYLFYGASSLTSKFFLSTSKYRMTPVENLKANISPITLNFIAETLYNGENSSLDIIKGEATNTLDYYLGTDDNYHHYTILGAGFVAACFLG